MKITEKITLNPEDITWFESDINYTKVNLTNGRQLIISYTLKKIADQVKSYSNFIRIHRSLLVNSNHIHSIEISDKDIFIYVSGNHRLLVSRRKRNLLKEIALNLCLH
ncbi:LytR/AlgR family response regulator transcription factor [Emticicia agri]|uniref:LytTR family transcriptional regulator n=1 Tax=Emticicia agri TaxID=2492393 RepID=A0A4Q5LZD6_9BACT|nr:LytTR family DNA-binding domain-containing protein [Emticicia agri]RYU95212.1 LytTR family transcriptional regulator [Emticicia agri]